MKTEKKFPSVEEQQAYWKSKENKLLAENKRLKKTLDAALRSRDRLIDPGEYHPIAKAEDK